MNQWRMAVYSFYPTLGVLQIHEDTDTGTYILKFHCLAPGGITRSLGTYKDFDSANEAMRGWQHTIQEDFEKSLNEWAKTFGFANKIGGKENEQHNGD